MKTNTTITFGVCQASLMGLDSKPLTGYEKWRGSTEILHEGFFSCYIHGELEYDVSYDIPTLLNGTIPVLNYGDHVPCQLIFEDKPIKAVMVVGKDRDRIRRDGGMKVAVYIVKHDDIESACTNFEVEFKSN